ncbi:GIY-YIG nuclease family protein [Psychroflexus sp. ALD_RP9]|uniref:GIY-YIG nuclease family protein n=1 Tax=Psychroflexus sp. ALD_RP9 TaxID=2777186 RepID=UPI001F5C0FF5|nr:GIY-YIG nuclease family protein [Psychroflexus sp. ALD_RP9]
MMVKGYMYILKCSNGSYYTGSTKHLERRLQEHQSGNAAKHTKKYWPVQLVYFETFSRIDQAFYREKQIQGWSRKKKEALINGFPEKLHELARCLNETSHVGFGSAQPTRNDAVAFDSAQPTDVTVVERSRNDLSENENAAKNVAFDSAQSTDDEIVERSRNNEAQSTRNDAVAERSRNEAVVERSRNDEPTKRHVERSRNKPKTQH